jgi:hypothetical protein
VAVCDRQTQRALSFAGTLASQVLAVHVRESAQQADDFEKTWARLEPQVPLVVLDAPSCDAEGHLVRALDALRRTAKADLITIVISRSSSSANLRGRSALSWTEALHKLPGIFVRNAPEFDIHA